MGESQYRNIEDKLRVSVMKLYEEDKILNEIEKGFQNPLDLESKHRVGYQGVPGSFGEAATLAFFKEGNDLLHYGSFKEVLQGVNSGDITYGVLPIENSFTGEVLEVYDLLNLYNLHIVGEYVLKVEHSLLGVEGSEIDQIKEVYSHPQAFSQCEEFLGKYPEMQVIPYHNTAMAAERIAKDRNRSKAAIGSARAAQIYGLKILAQNIANMDDNYTRFIVIGKYIQMAPKCDKVSIVFKTKHTSGALYSILSHFAYNGLNLLKIHSRPERDKTWHYYFFIDIEGNLEDANMLIALGKVDKECEYFRILGSYTRCIEQF